MRPIRLTYTPAAADLTRFASNVTGASWTISTTTTSDGLAHTVTIRNDSVTDHSGKTVVLTGTDSSGYALVHTMALPGPSATVTSTVYFATLATAVPSATIGADTMDIGQGAALVLGIGEVIPLDWRSGIVGVDIIISGTVNYTVQFTDSDVQSLENRDFDWINSPDTDVVGATATQSTNFTAVPVGMRVLVNSQSGNPTIKLYITQANGGL